MSQCDEATICLLRDNWLLVRAVVFILLIYRSLPERTTYSTVGSQQMLILQSIYLDKISLLLLHFSNAAIVKTLCKECLQTNEINNRRASLLSFHSGVRRESFCFEYYHERSNLHEQVSLSKSFSCHSDFHKLAVERRKQHSAKLEELKD